MDNARGVVDQLVPFLVVRGYEPGERIPSERDLAERFGVSRGQVREALAFLGALRVIERREKSGIFMAAEPSSIEALALFAQIGVPLSAEEVHQSVEMRRIHEIEAVRLACERWTDENIERIQKILDEEETNAKAGKSIAEQDRLFHAEIVKATQNGIFFRIVNIFYLMTAERRQFYFRDPQRCRRSHREHLRLFDAIVNRDTEKAVELMSAHLQGVDSYWRGLLGEEGR
ncbi:FadR/GntR family transcriptional regulator [Actinopolymorpha sp. B17G11]|uniref:FadR/GntR family transcriptional regulator n=1 Tax=Actinopolymorpha sp. B17G11 TaxID=3160861 RepID=UPI0032E373A0